MFKFFESITGIVQIAVDFIVSMFQMVVFLFDQIPKALAYVGVVTALLPAFLKTFVLLFVGIIVVLQIMNKGS
ncbi:MAG: hypothetical protein HFG62_06040 [Lachnospiraceae bacterium]|nr:hypothetical protein [Lachnospiraceae bacterium]